MSLFALKQSIGTGFTLLRSFLYGAMIETRQKQSYKTIIRTCLAKNKEPSYKTTRQGLTGERHLK
jgi:hypothetical protein